MSKRQNIDIFGELECCKRMRTNSVASCATIPTPRSSIGEFVPSTPLTNTSSVVASVPSVPDSCKCTKNGCLKLYCECFKHERYCSGDCKCVRCKNNDRNEQRKNAMKRAKEKSPLTFKGMSNSGTLERGCSCKNSKCLKNYCECFQNGGSCGTHCRCINCGNSKSDLEEAIKRLLCNSEITLKFNF